MSHQSLKDLVDVTGTPSDGQILKYTASSTSWGPAAESGGGGPEYLEIWDNGTTNGKAQSAYPLFQASDGTAGHIIYNGLDSSEWGRLGTLAAGSVGGSWGNWNSRPSYLDDLIFIMPHGSDPQRTYVLRAEYLISMSSTSTAGWYASYATCAATNSIQTGDTNNLRSYWATSSTMDRKSEVYGTPTGIASPWDSSKKWAHIVHETTHVTHATKPISPNILYLYGGSNPNYSGFVGFTGASYQNTTMKYKRVRLTKVS